MRGNLVHRAVLGASAAAIAALTLLAAPAQAAAVPGQGTWETTLQARDINGDSVVDAYYDTALDITWLADWNVNGGMTAPAAIAWAAALNVYGTTAWRLPSTVDAASSNGQQPPASSSEMAHMYYVTLGNIGAPDPGSGLSNTANFVNMENWLYWSGTASTLGDGGCCTWYFWTGDGSQGPVPNDWLGGAGFAVAVHDGDVLAVPEPQTLALMLAGLAALVAVRRRRPS